MPEYQFQTGSEFTLAVLEKTCPQLLIPPVMVQTSGRMPREPLLGIIAYFQGQAVALAVIECQEDYSALLLSWNVLPQHRNYGLGTVLLHKMQQFAKAHAINTLCLSFRADSTSQSSIRKILSKLNWQTPSKQLMLYKFSPEKFLQLTCLPEFSLPKQYEIFPWQTLTAADKHAIINRQQQSEWYPRSQSPLFGASHFETANSLGLRKQGRVVGWLITHRVHADVIEYSSLFVSPEIQPLGRGIWLIIEAVKRQHAQGITRGIFQVPVSNTAMNNFVQTRLATSITAQTSRCMSKINL